MMKLFSTIKQVRTGAIVLASLYVFLLGAASFCLFAHAVPLDGANQHTQHTTDHTTAGFWYAVSSGALASRIGYAIWYSALPALKSTNAATIQLSVPVLAALGGIGFLGEPVTLRFVLASIAILGGIALGILEKQYASDPQDIVPAKHS